MPMNHKNEYVRTIVIEDGYDIKFDEERFYPINDEQSFYTVKELILSHLEEECLDEYISTIESFNHVSQFKEMVVKYRHLLNEDEIYPDSGVNYLQVDVIEL